MKKILIAVVILLLVFAGLHFVLKNRSVYEEKPVPAEEAEEVTLLVDPALSETRTYKDSTAYAVFDVAYPAFKNASPEFNQKIEDFVMEAVRNHTQDAEANGKIQKPEEKYQFYASWTPVQVNGSYISFLLRLGGYLGGAHDYHNLASFNYDVKAGEEITLGDLFPSDPSYLKTISDFARKDLRRQFGKNAVEDMLLAGTEPTQENFSVFTFTPSEITFYFAEYQVAPYAMGESKVAMPLP